MLNGRSAFGKQFCQRGCRQQPMPLQNPTDNAEGEARMTRMGTDEATRIVVIPLIREIRVIRG
jgi:hypothetical protein